VYRALGRDGEEDWLSGIAVERGRARWLRGIAAGTEVRAAPDARRALQLALAALWLLDGVLQYQSFMFTRAFGQMIGATASGNPSAVAAPITWNAHLVEHHIMLLNALFATVQLLLGLGIAWRPTVRLALAASIVWSPGVWWFGEGLGGVLSGAADPVNGAPGAVIIYALLAVLLWPADRLVVSGAPAPFVAARAVGAPAARALWLVLWGSLAYFALGWHRGNSAGWPPSISIPPPWLPTRGWPPRSSWPSRSSSSPSGSTCRPRRPGPR
jgi:hypothetical protein